MQKLAVAISRLARQLANLCQAWQSSASLAKQLLIDTSCSSGTAVMSVVFLCKFVIVANAKC